MSRLSTIRLVLARNSGFPEGSVEHGYELNVPLSPDAHIDLAAFHERRPDCTFTRFWGDEGERHGQVVHGRHGWAFSYEPGEDDDEPILRLEGHVLRPGEYVTVREANGESLTFRVVSVR